MQRIFRYRITVSESGQTILQFLKAKGYSKQNVVALKKIPESILVNGKWKYVNQPLQNDDILEIIWQEESFSEKIIPVDLPLDIIYEDEDILVVNKPCNMPVHPSLNNYNNTLANAVAFYYEQQNIPFVFRCINRLDRDTTGLTLIAKHSISASILSGQMLRREIHREYLAIAEGEFSEKKGTIDAPIARVSDSLLLRCVDFEGGEPAVTHFQVLSNKNGYSLLSLHLETGRTHQIRVHMKYLGHPLIGDFLYESDQTLIQRQALHSYRLTFRHPITGIHLTFTSSLPEDMNIIGFFPENQPSSEPCEAFYSHNNQPSQHSP